MTLAKKVILDCDPGIGPHLDADDGLAILFALASPEVELTAVSTVFGNVAVERAADNALRVLEAAGRTDIPVAQGLGTPLTGRLTEQNIVEFAEQDERLMPVREGYESKVSALHAVDLIIDQVMAARPGEMSIVAVGPLTNVAMALLKQPELKTRLGEIVIMGGAFGRDAEFGRGNVTPVAELNVWNDPLAARIVFQSGVRVTAAGLDITNPNAKTVLYEDQLLGLLDRPPSDLRDFLEEMCRTYIDAPKFTWAQKGCVLYDPVAVATFAIPDIVETFSADVHVVQDGFGVGQTIAVADENGTARPCVSIDGDRFSRIFLERIARLLDGTTNA